MVRVAGQVFLPDESRKLRPARQADIHQAAWVRDRLPCYPPSATEQLADCLPVIGMRAAAHAPFMSVKQSTATVSCTALLLLLP